MLNIAVLTYFTERILTGLHNPSFFFQVPYPLLGIGDRGLSSATFQGRVIWGSLPLLSPRFVALEFFFSVSKSVQT